MSSSVKKPTLSFLIDLHSSLDSQAKAKFIFAALTAVVTGGLAASVPLILSNLADGAYFKATVDTSEVSYHEIILLVTLYVLAISLNKSLASVGIYLQSLVRLDILKALSSLFFDYLLAMPPCLYAKQNVGHIAQRLNQVGGDIYVLLRGTLFGLAAPVIQLIVTSIILLYSNNFIVVFLFVAYAVVYFTYLNVSSESLAVERTKMMNAGRETYSVLADSILNVEVARSFGTSTALKNRYQRTLFNDRAVQQGYWKQHFNQMVIINILFVIAFGLCVAHSSWQVLTGQATPGYLVLVATYVISLSSPMEAIGSVFSEIKQSIVSLRGFVNDTPRHHIIASRNVCNSTPSVKVRDLTFSYEEHSAFRLNIANIELEAGKVTAITGESGSGKSSLVNILTGGITNYAGSVKISDQDVCSVNYPSLQKKLVALNQSVSIFQDSLRFNLQIASDTSTDDEMIEALYLAGLQDFYSGLHSGLDTLIGDRGCTISGGQRQRINIARLFLCTPEIIILDESTAALDVESERLVLENIVNVFRNSVLLFISHRETVLRHADKIIVMEKGSTTSEGTHAALIATSQYYRDLINTQSIPITN